MLLRRFIPPVFLSVGAAILFASWPAASPICPEGPADPSGRVIDLTGCWNIYVTAESTQYEEPPLHMQIRQLDGVLTLDATCNADFPAGTGALERRFFSFSFDLGAGASIDARGRVRRDALDGFFTSPDGEGTLRAERAGPLDCGLACDDVAVPRFVEVDYLDLSLVEQVSKLRSGHGHDYSDFCESCRSMKHYYYFYEEFITGNGIIEIRSPVDGTIVRVVDDGHGASPGLANKEVFIRSSQHPTIFFVLSHLDLRNPGMKAGRRVRAGEVVGHARLYYPDVLPPLDWARGTEIAVVVHTAYGRRFVPYTDTMTDALFGTYLARGASDRSDFIIPRPVRDADPFGCVGEEFTHAGSDPTWWVVLSLPEPVLTRR